MWVFNTLAGKTTEYQMHIECHCTGDRAYLSTSLQMPMRQSACSKNISFSEITMHWKSCDRCLM